MTQSGEEHQPPWVPDDGTFGARLALVRQKMGWGNVRAAAEACGLPAESWRRWERDNMQPHRLVTIAMAIATRTNVDVDWLIRGNRPARPGSDITVGDFIGVRMLTPHPALAARVIPRQRARHGDGRKRAGSIPRRVDSPILDKAAV